MTRILGLGVSLSAIAACSSGGLGIGAPTTTTTPEADTTTSTTAATSTTTTGVETWVSDAPTPHSRLAAAGDSVIYASVNESGGLDLVALDAMTGVLRWSQPTTHSDRIQGVELFIGSDERAVFHFQQRATGFVEVVAVDPISGEERWRTPVDAAGAVPPVELCGGALCVATGEPETLLRLDASTGAVLSVGDAIGEPLIGSDDDAGLAVWGDRNTGELLMTAEFGVHEAWRKPISEVFQGLDVHPDHGWSAFARTDGGVWVIWLGGAADEDIGGLAAFDDAGTTLWTRPSTDPCFAFETFDTPWTIACSGTVTDEGDVFRFVVNRIEGIAPTTGETIWALDGVNFDDAGENPPIRRVDQTTYLLDSAGTPTLLDVATGPRPLDGDEPAGWCGARPPFEEWPTIESSEFGPLTFIPATSFHPCGPGGSPLDEPPASVPEFAGVMAAGYGVWVQDGRVHGAKVG